MSYEPGREPARPKPDRRLTPYIGVSLVILSVALLALSIALSYRLVQGTAQRDRSQQAPAATVEPPTRAPAPPAASATAAGSQPETPTAARLPTAGATPAPSPIADDVAPAPGLCGRGVVVGVAALNIRSEPTLRAPALAAVAQAEAVDLLCTGVVQADERIWRQVRYKGVEGWMSERFLDIQVVAGQGQPAQADTVTARQEATAPSGAGLTYTFPVRGPGISYEAYHHDYPATDIFAPIGSEFVAPTSGRIDFVNREDLWDPATDNPADRGGVMLAMIGDDGVRYYGSHLSSIADGIEVGVRVTVGQLLGFTGASGNALDTPPHLHFGISRPTTPDDWRTRRGEIPPFPYLQAWSRGEMLTPDLGTGR